MKKTALKNGIYFSPAKDIAYIAVMCALLIGSQFALSFVAGVEIVTVLFICFSYVFGVRRGALCAIAFSLLRCMIFGAYPAVIILYLIYYPLLAALFGALGHIDFEVKSARFTAMVNVLLLSIAAACAVIYFSDIIKVSRLYQVTINALLWVVFAILIFLCATYNILAVLRSACGKNTNTALRLVTITSIAAACTVFFTLLDDVITPMFFAYSHAAWIGYIYASFLAMLPQTICTVVTVITLFIPISSAMKRAARVGLYDRNKIIKKYND